MKIILLGLPGAGKGAQGKKLSQHFYIPHVSVGDLVRDIITTDSSLSHEIRSTFGPKKWSPLPDDLASKIVNQGIVNLPSFILDGFPRNVAQAKNMDFLGHVDLVIFLNANEGVCRERVLGRGRDGDSVEKFEQRLLVENERLPELLSYIRSKFTLIEVNADKSEEKVFASILNRMNTERNV